MCSLNKYYPITTWVFEVKRDDDDNDAFGASRTEIQNDGEREKKQREKRETKSKLIR